MKFRAIDQTTYVIGEVRESLNEAALHNLLHGRDRHFLPVWNAHYLIGGRIRRGHIDSSVGCRMISMKLQI
jgi:hypothetical protein